jgi:hypothetical protein
VWTIRMSRALRLFIGAAVTAALAGSLVSTTAAQTPAPYVKVVVDGSRVYFSQTPVVAGGPVLVPLRGVFERLGAGVTWNPDSQTIFAQRGPTDILLSIGARRAFVDGQIQVLDVPPMLVGGRTMIPLRFVSQALGASVGWDAATATVEIASRAAIASTAVPPAASYPPAPVAQTIAGTVTQINASVYPRQLTLQASTGALYTRQIVSGTAITRTDATTGVTTRVPLGGIEGGDFVTVTSDRSGTALSVQASYDTAEGTIASAGFGRIVLRNGQAYTLAPAAQVMRHGRIVAPAALRPGDVAAFRVNPETGLVYRVTVRREGPAGGVTAAIMTSARGWLRTGDALTVLAAGPAHGTATFTITGVRTGLPMRESPARPGRYIGRYVIQPGDYVAGGSVVVTVTTADGRMLSATAPVSVSISSSAIIPPAVGGAPVITNPAPGGVITTPFTVTGTAPPGSLVRVSADYQGHLLSSTVRGRLGTQTVLTDANGNWSATFGEAPPVRGVNVTISAVRIDHAGAARSPSIVVNSTLN